MKGNSKNAKKKKKRAKGLLFLCLLLLLASGGALWGLNETRKELIKECENDLLWDVQLSAREVSDSITQKFANLEAVHELVGRSNFSMDAAKSLEASRERYHMSYLGLINPEYVYYDSTGKMMQMPRVDTITAAMNGAAVVNRTDDEVTGDGVVFMMPYKEGSRVLGVICSKYAKEELLVELSVKPQEGTELVVNSSGSVILISDEFNEYLDGMSWEEFSENANSWKQKVEFDKEIQLKGCAVSNVQNKNGRDIYFAAAQIDSYKEFFVVRLMSSKVVEEEVRIPMLRIYVMMVFMVVFMAVMIIAVLVSCLKNRKEVYNAAYVDQLTGIPSKTKHKLDAQELIDRREKRYAYMTFDVDNFKYINEMFGYEYGNRILIHIAKVIAHVAKEDELYARISSDNFVMLLEDMGTQKELTERIEDVFRMILEYREPEEDLSVCNLSFSCGVYRIDGKMDINTVRANANLARTESKKSVMDEIVFYDENLKTRRVEEKELEYEAEQALVNEEFLVYFQPKYDVVSEKIIGAEALVRWNHPVRGMLSPGLFVPVFETNGFITEVDLYVLNRVCELIESWLKDGIPPICISVNLSRVHLYERDLVQRLTEVVNRHNVPPEYIEFELTESAFYEETDSLLRVMSEIKAVGFRLSMDDFGSGYSSLNLLRRLPVDVLKLDKVFLEDCDEDDNEVRGKRIVMHVISMAKDLKMEVLAEGVETKDQKEFLQNAKCDMIQGFYFARPMPTKEFEVLYKGQNACSKKTAHQSVVKEEKENPAEKRVQGEA